MAPPQPVIPNAAEDPFGAMNAMAAVGTVQRAPEIVIVNDGKPVENVGSSSMGTRIAKVAIPAVAMLALGVAVGKVSASANHHNEGVAGAKALLGDDKSAGTVRFLKKQLADLTKKISDAKERNGLKPEAETEKEIAKYVDALQVPPQKLAVARNLTNIGDTATSLIKWYAGVAEVQSMLESHGKAGKFDAQQKLLEKAQAAGEAAKFTAPLNKYLAPNLRYAIVMSAKATCDEDTPPQDRAKKGCDAPFGAQFVELGPPMCNGALSSSGQCPEGSEIGVSYRVNPSDANSWKKANVVMETTDTVAAKGLVPLLETEVLMTFLKGNEPGASEVLYTRRLRAIAELAAELIKNANKLESDMLKNAGSERFTFFL